MIQVDPNNNNRVYILMIEPPNGGKRVSRHLTVHGLDPIEVERVVSRALLDEQTRRISAFARRSGGAHGGPPNSGTGKTAMGDMPDAGAGQDFNRRPSKRRRPDDRR